MTPEEHIDHLQRREIQAPLVAALIEGFAERFGREEALAVAREVISRDAALSGRELAERFGGNGLPELWRLIEEVWAEDDIMQIENLRREDDALHFDVTRCGYAEMYERLGLKELGTLLSCERDFAFPEGFNPELELVRTRTLMEGHDRCDFCYRKRGGEDGRMG